MEKAMAYVEPVARRVNRTEFRILHPRVQKDPPVPIGPDVEVSGMEDRSEPNPVGHGCCYQTRHALQREPGACESGQIGGFGARTVDDYIRPDSAAARGSDGGDAAVHRLQRSDRFMDMQASALRLRAVE
jgi:hypothetical protein